MTNTKAVERFDQSHAHKIDKLFWIAASIENRDLHEFIEDDMDEKDFKKCFPDVPYQSFEAVVDFKKFGLLAELHIPTLANISFKDGKPSSWSVNAGVCRIEYVYGETREELMTEIEKRSEQVFQNWVEDYQKKKSKPAPEAQKK